MRARNWKQAADDFFRAWEKGNHPIDLLRWAESLLHQRNSSADAERQVAEGLDLRYFEGNDELRHLAAFLRWLATHREVDAAKVLHSYSVTPVHSSVIMDDERTLAVLACAKPEYAECRVYRILTQPKQSEAEEELRRLLSQLTSTGD